MTRPKNGSGRGKPNGAGGAIVRAEPDIAGDVLRLVVAGQWEPGASDQELADQYAVPVERVRRLASDAGRLVARSHGEDADATRGLLLSRLAGLRRMALERRRTYMRADGSVIDTPDPDVAAAVKVEALVARIVGADVQRVDLKTQSDLRQHDPAEIATGALEWLKEHAPDQLLEAGRQLAEVRALTSEGDDA